MSNATRSGTGAGRVQDDIRRKAGDVSAEAVVPTGRRNPEHASLLTKISGIWMTRVISFAVTSGLFDAFAVAPLSVDMVVERLALEPDPLERILKGLVQLDLLHETQGIYDLTLDGRRLTTAAEHSLAPLAALWGGSFDKAWSMLGETAQTGRSGFERALGYPLFEHLACHGDEARLFDGAMRGLIATGATSAADMIASRGDPLVCDVGGGDGTLLRHIVERTPGTGGLLFDQKDVIAAIRDQDLPASIETVAGDFFECVPKAPVHILSNILHDWNDAQASAILRSVAAAQPADGTIFIIEPILGEPDEPIMARAFDLHMMMLTGGRERTAAQLAGLLGQIGYDVDRIDTLGELYRLLQAKRRCAIS